ncbi:CtrA inhibitor SciP [Yoonia sp.]|uniref:CtrA inhibitor SciP n=1 Tax=Yoonia sp. TaxID=2212373 RepID=UPI002FDB6B70
MYLRKVDGPRSVTLPDGSVLTRADLPASDTRRWVASRKAVVIKAVTHGLITRQEALERYALSEDELDEWEAAMAQHGEAALKATALQKYRQP